MYLKKKLIRILIHFLYLVFLNYFYYIFNIEMISKLFALREETENFKK